MKDLFLKKLYAILDLDSMGESLVLEIANVFLKEGGSILQLRTKKKDPLSSLPLSHQLRQLTLNYKALFIINDFLELALRCGADGIHLGQEDLPVPAARAKLGPGQIIGLSTHNLNQIEEANRLPIDYIGFGPVFPTQSKKTSEPAVGLSLLREAMKRSNHPVVAIGGIHLQNLDEVLTAKPHAVAMIQGLLSPPPPLAVQKILQKLSPPIS